MNFFHLIKKDHIPETIGDLSIHKNGYSCVRPCKTKIGLLIDSETEIVPLCHFKLMESNQKCNNPTGFHNRYCSVHTLKYQ